MGLGGISGSSGNNLTGSGVKATGGAPVGGGAPTVAVDSLSLSSTKPTFADDMAKMTPKQAEHDRSLGGKVAAVGIAGLMGTVIASSGLYAIAGTMALPYLLGAAFGIAAVWGVFKFAKGLGAGIQQKINSATTGIDNAQ